MNWIDSLEQYLLPCPTKYFFGTDCPGCGMQRSFLFLIKGNFYDSLRMYPGLIPVLFTLVFLALHLRFKFENGAKVLQYSYIFTAAVIVTTFIFKQVNNLH